MRYGCGSRRPSADQEALSKFGYDPGHADGVVDASTHTAVQKFQQARGLRVTGAFDPQTMAALGVALQ
jgi:peptidoglycan hydrolase-like protein with peptidoglycan-binding domain